MRQIFSPLEPLFHGENAIFKEKSRSVPFHEFQIAPWLSGINGTERNEKLKVTLG